MRRSPSEYGWFATPVVVALGLGALTAPGLTRAQALAGGPNAATGSRLRVLRSHQISTANPTRPHVESFLAIDPRDARHLVAASMGARAGGELGTFIYVTFDGGRSWAASQVAPADSALLKGGDPIVYVTREGSVLFAIGGRDAGRPATLVSRSTDGGRSWRKPLVLNYRDRPYMAFDTTASRLDGTIYLAGQYGAFLLSRSADDGASFTRPDIVSRDLGGPDPSAPVRGVLTDMLVTPDGVLVMPFVGALDMRDSTATPNDTLNVLALRLLVSDDGGRSFSAVREAPHMNATGGFRGVQGTAAPRAAIDQSRGSYRGRIYLVWPDWDVGRHAYVVRLASSSDVGKTWKTTVVNDNADGHDPGNPAIAVNRDGVVAVVWNDRRDDAANKCWRLYGAVSVDGGETFLPNAKMSDAPTCTNGPGNWVLNTWYQYDDWTTPAQPRPGFGVTAYIPVRFPNGGDTQGLVADAAGTFHAAWINGETGTLQLWYTTFAVDDALGAEVRARNASHTTSPTAEPPPAGKVELTQELTFDVSAPRIDFAKGTLEVTMRVVNSTARPVRAPIEVILDRMTSQRDKAMGLANFKVANADNRHDGVGAAWNFAAGASGTLPPNGKTASRVLRFTFTGGVPAEPDGYFEPAFRVFAPAAVAGAARSR